MGLLTSPQTSTSEPQNPLMYILPGQSLKEHLRFLTLVPNGSHPDDSRCTKLTSFQHWMIGKYRKHVLGFLAVFPQTNPVLPMKRLVCIFILVSETPECVGSIIKISWRLNPNPNSCRFNTHFLLVKSKFPAGELHFFHPDLSGAGTVAECMGSGSVAGIRWRCAVGGPVALSYILYMLYVCIMYMYTCIYIIYIYISIYLYTSSTARGGGGSFKNRKPIGEVGCCDSGMAERSH